MVKIISNCGSDERGKYSGGQSGDQTGGEWTRKAWYSRPWSCVLRYPDRSAAGLIAQLAGEAADNNKVGYDQNQRITFWDHLKASNYFPSGITVACEADCSSGVAAIVKAAGYILGISALKNVSVDMYTGNERQALKNAGFAVLTDSQYLTSDAYLMPGDILLYDGHHTATNLDWGGKIKAMALNAQTFLNAVRNAYLTAHNGGYRYGNSQSTPPCADHVTSCDRLVARALWDLGYHDQPKGGFVCGNIASYLTKYGAVKITDPNALKAGDVVLMADGSGVTVHVFVINSFANANSISKYDFGSQERIGSAQPYQNVPLNEWGASRKFQCAFRFGGSGVSGSGTSPESYSFTPQAVKYGSNSLSAYLATEILKARGYRGVVDTATKKQKELALNKDWSIGDMAAMAKYKADRMKNKTALNGEPGEVNADNWRDLLGSNFPFVCPELPTKQKKGTAVLLAQEILRSRGIAGKDGKSLELDQEWGPNMEHAVKSYQKARGMKEDGILGYDTWKDMLGGL